MRPGPWLPGYGERREVSPVAEGPPSARVVIRVVAANRARVWRRAGGTRPALGTVRPSVRTSSTRWRAARRAGTLCRIGPRRSRSKVEARLPGGRGGEGRQARLLRRAETTGQHAGDARLDAAAQARASVPTLTPGRQTLWLAEEPRGSALKQHSGDRSPSSRGGVNHRCDRHCTRGSKESVYLYTRRISAVCSFSTAGASTVRYRVRHEGSAIRNCCAR